MVYRRAEQEQVANACPNPGFPEEFQQSIFFFLLPVMSLKNMERFTNLRVILAQGPC